MVPMNAASYLPDLFQDDLRRLLVHMPAASTV